MSEIYLFQVSDMVVIKIIDVIHQKKNHWCRFLTVPCRYYLESVLKVGATRSWIGHWKNYFFIWAADLGTTHSFVFLSLSFFFFFDKHSFVFCTRTCLSNLYRCWIFKEIEPILGILMQHLPKTPNTTGRVLFVCYAIVLTLSTLFAKYEKIKGLGFQGLFGLFIIECGSVGEM